MSLDLTACCSCGSRVVDENITYNVSPIYYRALRAAGVRGGLRGLDGMTLEEAAPIAANAHAFAKRWHHRLVVHEPDNGWGSIYCVYRVFRAIRKGADLAPDAVLDVV